jgi:membrane protein YqaA with SNARE-associated domain
LNESFSLAALFLSSFLAATLLPGGSEFVLAGVLATGAASLWPSLLVATLGNTLGGTTSWLIGRLIPNRALRPVPVSIPQRISRPVPPGEPRGRALEWVRRWGAPVLVLSWVPLIGDALCVAAGWLRLNLWWSILFMALGKFARYYLIGRILA